MARTRSEPLQCKGHKQCHFKPVMEVFNQYDESKGIFCLGHGSSLKNRLWKKEQAELRILERGLAKTLGVCNG